MRVQPNYVLAVIGLVLALVTGSYTVNQWAELTELKSYEASFHGHHIQLPDQAGTSRPGQTEFRRASVDEPNVTTLVAEVTWSDPSPLFSQPRMTLRIKDPTGEIRAMDSHTGGAAGIRLRVEVIPSDDVPKGTVGYEARGRDGGNSMFQDRWPTHKEAMGNWTFELQNVSGSPAASVPYTLRVGYDIYEGEWRPAPSHAGVK